MMKRAGVLVFAVLCLGVVPRGVGADAALRIKLGTLAPKGTSYHLILQEMAEKWRQAPGGGVHLTIYADGTMGGEADMVRRMRVGQLQSGLLTVVGLSEIDDAVNALQSLPMAFRNLDEVDYVRQKLRPEIEKKLEAKGFIVLFWADAGWVRFFSRRPAVYPDDFKKIKIFTWAGNPQQVDIMKAAGYHPVPLEPTDVLTGLETGLIDAVPSTPFYALAGQLYRAAPHMLSLNWAPMVGGLVLTKKAWDKLEPAQQDAARGSADEAGEKFKVRSRTEADEAVEAMKKRGLTVHTLDPAAEAAWQKAIDTLYPHIRGRIVPADLFDRVLAILKEYRAQPGASR